MPLLTELGIIKTATPMPLPCLIHPLANLDLGLEAKTDPGFRNSELVARTKFA
jgi:hypothetical protein